MTLAMSFFSERSLVWKSSRSSSPYSRRALWNLKIFIQCQSLSNVTCHITFRIGQSSLGMVVYMSRIGASRLKKSNANTFVRARAYGLYNLVCRDQPRGPPSVDPSTLGRISPYVTRLPQVLFHSIAPRSRVFRDALHLHTQLLANSR